MSKTELTKKIENALFNYNPTTLGGLKLNPFRLTLQATEVTVENSSIKKGIIDFMRFDEYEHIEKVYNGCRIFSERHQVSLDIRPCLRGFKDWRDCAKVVECDQVDCRWYLPNIKVIDYKPLFTCIEIKISKADFRSKNGHNFVGNLNYYVMPIELWRELKANIPEGIGVISYNGYSLRRVKDATYKELSKDNMFERLLCLAKARTSRGFGVTNTE